ncbi:MAG: hypothetical protein IID34_04250 [Planctomycetes bacterium]|nr:hypothetical protein [Planctomycetota bacterium]
MNRVARDRVQAVGPALITGVLLMLVVTASVRADTGAATVAESAPINDLLERARRGIERGDWKFVVDSLQRVIEEPQGALTTRDGRVYESARMQAYRQLADLPPAAMSAYHLLHDGEAGRLYEEAVESYDFVKLQRVVDRYLLTQSGDLAAVTLAGWFIDLGKPGSAIATLTDLRNLRRDTGDSATKAAAMMAVAYAQLRRPSAAAKQIEKIRLGGDLDETWENRLDHIAAYVADSQPRLHAGHQSAAAEGWPVSFGSNARTGRMPATTPVLLDGLPWHRDLPPYASPAPWSAVVERQLETSRLLASHMLVSGNDLYFKTGGRIFSMDLLSIELNWSTSRPPTRTTRRSANRLQRFNPWSTPQPNTPAAEEARRVDAALSDGVAAAISIAHGLVFELVPEPWDASNPFRSGVPRARPAGSMQPPENTLVARELHARDQVWALGAGASRPPHEMIFTSTPLAVGTGAGEALLVTYRDGQDFYAGLLDPFDDGNELKRVYLCTMTPDFLDVPDLLPPAADDQFAYIPTNAGLLLAVNLGDLSLRWASRYERRAAA